MTRHLTFKHSENRYVLIEDEQVVFAIDAKELQFNSLLFYQGIYADKSKSSRITIVSELEEKDRIGRYIEQWLKQIMNKIADAIGDAEEVVIQDTEIVELNPAPHLKEIPFYDLPVCAGNGLYTDSPSSTKLMVSNLDADYAVKVSGHSMEPLYGDGDILLIHQQETLNHGDVAIINVNGDSYCRFYRKEDNAESFEALNDDQEYEVIIGSDETPVAIQGKVLGTYSED